MINLIIVFFILITFIDNQNVSLNGFHLHEYNIDNNWQYLQKSFNQTEQIKQLYIRDCIVTEAGITNLLKQNLSSLQVLNLTNLRISPPAIKMLLVQDFIYSLETLVLDNCNLQCEDIENILVKPVKWKKISLSSNLITMKGYQHLAKLSMNLTYLNVYGTSLVNTKSVESLISLGLQNLEVLQIGQTSISSKDLLKILEKISKSKLLRLSFRQNVFPIQFYIQFSKMQFPLLQKLDLFGLLLGQQVSQIFSNMKFPSLKNLILYQNEFETKDLIKFLTKQNYPILQRLNVNLNFLDQGFYKHLANEKFILKELYSKIIQMNKQGLYQVSKINWSEMQSFHFNFATVTPQILQNFFYNVNLSKLKIFNMRSVANTGNFFKILTKHNWSTLQQIVIPDVGIIQKTDLKQNLFPNLKKAQFIDFYNTLEIQKTFLQQIHSMAPKLQQLHYLLDDILTLIQAIFNQTIKIKVKIPLKLTISLKSQFQRQLQRSTKLLEMIILPKQNPQIIYLNQQLFQIIMVKMLNQTTNLNISQIQQQIIQNKKIFLQQFNITYVNNLVGSNSLLLLYAKQINGQCVFPNLTAISITLIPEQIEFHKNCSLPSLAQLTIFSPQSENQNSQQDNNDKQKQNENLNKTIQTQPFPQFPYLQNIDFSNIQKNQVFKILNENKYKLIQKLNLDNLQLFPQQLKNITQKIPYFNRIRQLTLSQNSLNKNFNQINTNVAKLKSLIISGIVFNDKVFQNDACLINYEFITQLSFTKTDVKDSNFINWIDCLSTKSEGPLFPKLEQANFDENSLGTIGINAFMQLNHPLLISVQFLSNKDPQIFNSIFRHPSSKRLFNFITSNNYFSGIDPTINPKNTRKIQIMKIQSSNMRSSDILAFSKLQFPSLISADMSFEKISDCQSLQILRKMCSKITLLQIKMKETNGLNSTCINKKESTKYLTSQIQIQIVGAYSQARNFVQYFITPGQSIITIFLYGTFISDSKLLQLSKTADLNYVEILLLQNNDLGDISVKQILSRNFTQLIYLNIAKNQRITSGALAKMKNLTFPKLREMKLSQTSIDDNGIQALVTNKFPQLMALHLKNVQITRKGLKKLEQFDAPKLTLLDISCNDLTMEDLLEFTPTVFENLMIITVYPSLTDKQMQVITKKWTLDGQNPISILTDVRRQQVEGLDFQVENY